MYFEPVIRASMSSIESSRRVRWMCPGVDRSSAGGARGGGRGVLTAVEVEEAVEVLYSRFKVRV